MSFLWMNPREPQPQPEPGEWQREPGPFGKRFRMVGNIKEYEMDINGIPESVFHDMKMREKEQAALLEKERQKAVQAARRSCPFADGANTDCFREKCAMFLDGCTIAALTPAKDTEGLRCPFGRAGRKCNKDCALYSEGCTLTGITQKQKSEVNKNEQI